VSAAGRVPFVGLTGGLGAGKSEALRALDELGAATISSDVVVHELLATDELRDLVVERMGAEVAPDGVLDRSRIAERVFGDDELRGWLEGLLWPRVRTRVDEWRSGVEAREPPPLAAVVEVPLLFESGSDALYDLTIAVIADEEVRERRAAARGHAAVASRAGRQLSQAEKAQRADFVVRNDGSLDALKIELSSVLATLGTNR
jgi:dephospho-CoA kinase